MKRLSFPLSLILLGSLALGQAQDLQVLSLARNGVITWTNSSLSVTCRVEWASSVEGPWHSSWESLSDIVTTNYVTWQAVPMFYRVVCSPASPPFVVQISATDAMDLLRSRQSDPNFCILDVRTPGEFAPRHIRGAVNLDFYSPTFQQDLDPLDRQKAYFVYCASGGRSGQAIAIMQELGFRYLYNLQGGMFTFQSTAGASEFLEP